ncbi:sarcolemma associated protein b [Conger conger]|uniref:sarcolemma associated protein b n=1 Tax=Conger conger TaxID=82655 RepID=UPI002A5AA2CA|nr:sarcolemma associated protein b [Conger conger]
MFPALVVFISCQNSHPFQERHVCLGAPVKIGRTVARSRPAENNAIFDCKVLSRTHALLWFDRKSAAFYLQDSGSSNGTFINHRRLSPPGEQSPPSQIYTGDIIQFGVDVTESSPNVSHGCVVSTVCLFPPGSVETSLPSVEEPPPPHSSLVTSLLHLEKDIGLADEEQLFSRIEIMEDMLQTLSGWCGLHLRQLRACAGQELNMAVDLVRDLTLKVAERQREERMQKQVQLLLQSLKAQKQEPKTNSDSKQHLTSLQESEMDGADGTVPGTLRRGTDCSNHSTGNAATSAPHRLLIPVRMEEKKEMEAMNNLTEDCRSGELQSREAGLKSREAELQSREAGLQSREAELRSREAELREAQDQAGRRCVELQDVLEKERRETQLHSQESANHIQALQAQVQKLQGQVKMLSAERDGIVSAAQDEARKLRGALEAGVSERERERAALQESLGAVTAELDRWRRRAAEGEQEAGSLRDRLQTVIQKSAQAAQVQGELQKNCTVLQTECATLRSEKTALQENMQHLEKELYSSRDQAALLGRNVSVLERTQGALESRLAEQQEQHQQDSARLKTQSDQAANRIKGLQREYEDTQVELVQVKQRCSEVEQEKLSLSEELQQCKDNLRLLQERTSRYEDTQVELVQVKQRCSEVEQEKLSLSEELQQCKDNLRLLQERTSRPSLQSVLPVLVGLVLAALFWGYSSLW